MRWFSNLPVQVKVYTAVLIALTGAVAIGVVGIQKLSATAEVAEYIYHQRLIPTAQLGDTQAAVNRGGGRQ